MVIIALDYKSSTCNIVLVWIVFFFTNFFTRKRVDGALKKLYWSMLTIKFRRKNILGINFCFSAVMLTVVLFWVFKFYHLFSGYLCFKCWHVVIYTTFSMMKKWKQRIVYLYPANNVLFNWKFDLLEFLLQHLVVSN